MGASVYTKTGDKGQTSLFTGERVSKGSLRVNAYGTIDEAQAFLGAARAYSEREDVHEVLLAVEKDLWLLMADVASLDSEAKITDERVAELEQIIDGFDAKLEPLTKFILPGDSKTSAFLHVARTVVRRGERLLWEVSENEAVHEVDIRYLNRLSDLIFILARVEDELK